MTQDLRIIDFDKYMGGLSSGLEECGGFVTTEAVNIDSNNAIPFFASHKQQPNIIECSQGSDADIAIFNPFLGSSYYSPKWDSDFDLTKLNDIFSWILKFEPRCAIICISFGSEKYLQSDKLIPAIDGWAAYDLVFEKLSSTYNCCKINASALQYGLSQDFDKVFYIAVHHREDPSNIVLPKPKILNPYDYHTIEYAIGDLNKLQYDDTFTNDFIAYCKKKEVPLSFHKPDYRHMHDIVNIDEGSKKDTGRTFRHKPIYRNIRPKYNKYSPNLRQDFYYISSNGPSIHPKLNRTLTIREGARLYGFPDHFTWSKQTKKKDIGVMLKKGVSPIFGHILSPTIKSILL